MYKLRVIMSELLQEEEFLLNDDNLLYMLMIIYLMLYPSTIHWAIILDILDLYQIMFVEEYAHHWEEN